MQQILLVTSQLFSLIWHLRIILYHVIWYDT